MAEKSNFVIKTEHPDYHKWTIHRPTRGNGLGPTVVTELLGCIADHKQLESPMPIVITATPLVKTPPTSRSDEDDAPTTLQATWIAGGDLKELSEFKTKNCLTDYLRKIHRIQAWIETHPAPVLMVIDGKAIGGGAEFSLWGDIRLASVQSEWQFKQGGLGLTTGFGGCSRLASLVGPTEAEALVYGIKTCGAAHALSRGMVHELAPSTTDLWNLVDGWCKTLRSWYGPSFAAQKEMFRSARLNPPGTCRQVEMELFARIWGNPVHSSKVARFLTPD